ncbi:hypothetical protein [Streptosporangium roseum]|uniref:hypothetical protein n=1 Tax=Streptosporangium roseum TaxID=2001 RepID=UPI0011D2442C|nr:hypothetical protein [Streptosporangium roseum]
MAIDDTRIAVHDEQEPLKSVTGTTIQGVTGIKEKAHTEQRDRPGRVKRHPKPKRQASSESRHRT